MSHILIPPALAMAVTGLGVGLWPRTPAPVRGSPLPALVLMSASAPSPMSWDVPTGPNLEAAPKETRSKQVRVVLQSPFGGR